jgi:ATP-dependent protease ClpP protease subunit
MCVPIFLAGTKRMADPEALFMFHQASLNTSANENIKRQEFSASEEAIFSHAVKAIETQATDDFFRNDIGIRGVNMVWLARMREKISGRDVWMSGQQLVDEGSGIVDRLIRTPAR